MKMKKTDWIKKFIKLICSSPSFYNVFSDLNNQSLGRAIIIGGPIHGNLGDHLIASESKKFIEELHYDRVIEVPEFTYELFLEKINIGIEDVIYIVGGGWMGDLYEDELVIEDIITRFSHNKIIILPQTVFFSGKGQFSSPLQLKKAISMADNLILCVRDRFSYDFCVGNGIIQADNCFLLPDMALLKMKDVKRKNHLSNKSVIFSLRQDAEQSANVNNLVMIRKELVKSGYSCKDVSTVLAQKIVKIKTRDRIIENQINEYANADLIITDRLHSMIFSLIAGTKCLAIDNATHKVVGVYNEWLNNFPGLRVMENTNNISYEDILEFLKSRSFPEKKDFRQKFNTLINRIKEDYK